MENLVNNANHFYFFKGFWRNSYYASQESYYRNYDGQWKNDNIEELSKYILQNYQEGLEESMIGSEFVDDCIVIFIE